MTRTPTPTSRFVVTAVTLFVTTALTAAAAAQNYYLVEDDGRGRAEKVATGYYHMCVLTHCGGIECGGGNWWGEGAAPDDRDFIDVAAGVMHSCGLHEDGTAECWGDNSYGQLDAPEDVVLTTIDAGWNHTCGITDDQRVVCWGDNSYGQLWPDLEDQSERFLTVEAGAAFSCATVELAGSYSRIVCWGMDYHGQMSHPGASGSDPIFSSYQKVTAGYGHGCALDDYSHVATCWGDDTRGQVSGEIEGAWMTQVYNPYWENRDGIAIQWYIPLSDISAGTLHTCAVRTNGALECWGDDRWGQANPPAGVFTQVSAGNYTSCAIDTEGHVECWGYSAWEALTLPDLSYACADNVVDWGVGYGWWWY